MPIPSLINQQQTAQITAAQTSGPSVLTTPSIFSTTEAAILTNLQNTLNILNDTSAAQDAGLLTEQTKGNVLKDYSGATDTNLLLEQNKGNTLQDWSASQDINLQGAQNQGPTAIGQASGFAQQNEADITKAQTTKNQLPDFSSTTDLLLQAEQNKGPKELIALSSAASSYYTSILTASSNLKKLTSSIYREDYELKINSLKDVGVALIGFSSLKRRYNAAIESRKGLLNTWRDTFSDLLSKDPAARLDNIIELSRGVQGKLFSWVFPLQARKRPSSVINEGRLDLQGTKERREYNRKLKEDQRRKSNALMTSDGTVRDQEFYRQNKIIISNLDAGPKPGQNLKEDITLQTWPREVDYMPESKFVAIASIARNNPHYQYAGSEDTLSFKISWFTDSKDRDYVIKQCRKIEALTKANGYQKKPPRVKIVWGKQDRLFRDQLWIVVAAPYKMKDFQSAYRDTKNGFTEIGNMPQCATQDITLKRITNNNRTWEQIRKVYKA